MHQNFEPQDLPKGPIPTKKKAHSGFWVTQEAHCWPHTQHTMHGSTRGTEYAAVADLAQDIDHNIQLQTEELQKLDERRVARRALWLHLRWTQPSRSSWRTNRQT